MYLFNFINMMQQLLFPLLAMTTLGAMAQQRPNIKGHPAPQKRNAGCPLPVHKTLNAKPLFAATHLAQEALKAL